MAEADKHQMGDGGDNYGQAAKQMANAAKQVGKKPQNKQPPPELRQRPMQLRQRYRQVWKAEKLRQKLLPELLREVHGARFCLRHGRFGIRFIKS